MRGKCDNRVSLARQMSLLSSTDGSLSSNGENKAQEMDGTSASRRQDDYCVRKVSVGSFLKHT